MMLLLTIIVLSGIALVVVPFLWESFIGPVVEWFDKRNKKWVLLLIITVVFLMAVRLIRNGGF